MQDKGLSRELSGLKIYQNGQSHGQYMDNKIETGYMQWFARGVVDSAESSSEMETSKGLGVGD